MSVTAAAGFRAAGVTAGLKTSGRPDLALVVNDGPLDAGAAVYTSNRCKAHPVLWSERASADGHLKAVVLNSGGANCFTGPNGFQTTHATAELVGELVGSGAGDVVVCSTGLIGVALPRQKVLDGVRTAFADLSTEGGTAAATAIMTTDTVSKQAIETGVGPQGDSFVVGGMAKGAGMLAPGLATMLVVLTTDAAVEPADLDRALRAATRTTFDRVDSDGCMSTNDTVVLLASGAGGVTPEPAEFDEVVRRVCADLARMLVGDAEGADHDIAIEVVGAAEEAEAVEVARSVARNNLFKAAVFGKDPNWGRVMAAVGTTSAQFDPQALDVSLNGVAVCVGGTPHADPATVDLEPREVRVVIDLHAGSETATVWTNDLTHAYVHENSAYSS
ncbi:bifunctional glutamate N-acetyltransferase/amino-acid acetyltransferase ArgJ [Kineococcus sp. R86509]|uniref:bifunctional glutamate N-acetyltransferase/amino-acid acetyltransferase ArgJ n=1 Tax=Kineococcus sp. R86509 TaxID=3093851 RepID=UPI0036D2952E